MKILITGGSGFIGTNLIDALISKNIDFINVDKQKPLRIEQERFWTDCNILNKKQLIDVFTQYNPTHVLHLAARTDTASDKLEDYIDNTEGTANLIQTIENINSVRHVIITSTQYVYKSKENPLPKTDETYLPHTAYGFSKKITEELTRNSSMKCAWTIIRPTNVWGPWNMRYPKELFRIVDKGLYIHPKNVNPIKSYAYVKNVVHQILKILESPTDAVNKKVYYVGDYPMNSIQWINCISKELTGKEVIEFPKFSLQLLSYIGDYLRKANIPFPLYSVRFNNMIDNYETPMEKTITEFGLSNPSFEENVKETIQWLKSEGKSYFDYWKYKP